MSASIRFDSVWKRFSGGVDAIKELSLDVNDGEVLVLLGTSGSGKTTTMKMVNRIIEPTSGTITLDGVDILTINPVTLRRKIGYAIQHIGLFPHMTIAENIGVVPRLCSWHANDIHRRVHEMVKLIGLDAEHILNRYPHQLSGGQRQRVGVARALAADPPVVLMDEPFGALDPITREQLQREFLTLQASLKKTILFVTHDVFEAVIMGDRIALLDRGVLRQVGTPREVVEHPADEFVDSFLGSHRFQLSLMTTTIEPIVVAVDSTNTVSTSDTHLTHRATLIDALDMFKMTDARALTVTRNGQPIGSVTRKAVADAIFSLVWKSGEGS